MTEIRNAFVNLVDTNEALEQLLKEADQNGDGIIDFEEFVDLVRTPTSAEY